MKTKHSLLFVFFAFAVNFLTIGCVKETDADKIADAQSCLDVATTTDVDGCLQKVEGLESEGAYLIRCAGAFIKEGFNTPSKLSTALSNLSSANGSGGAASLSVIQALAFTSKSTSDLNATYASDTFTNCEKSKSNGLILLSGLTVTATTFWKYIGGSSPPTLNDLQTNLPTMINDPTTQALVGEAAVSMYETNCQASNSAPGSFCAQFQSVVNSSGGTDNSAAVGKQLMTCYQNPNATGCSSF